jgi:hypothetical protein
MAKITLTADKLAQAINQELTTYHEETLEKLRRATRQSMADLVKKTRATAPERTGAFRRHISGDFSGLARGLHTVQARWYVKAPHYRLTHLLVHGHAKPDGGRVKGDPFLENALNEVLPEYEKAVEEALKND